MSLHWNTDIVRHSLLRSANLPGGIERLGISYEGRELAKLVSRFKVWCGRNGIDFTTVREDRDETVVYRYFADADLDVQDERAMEEWINDPEYPITSMRKGAPFADYADFDACVAANQDKDSPEAYCGTIQRNVEGAGISSRKRTASMWDEMDASAPRHVVAGWDWDERLSGYVTDATSAHFACLCGANVEAPGYNTCVCGKVWNSYPIQANGTTKVICREIPVRDLLLASRSSP